VLCRIRGYVLQDGDPWWYRLVSEPWNGHYYATSDAFYNNGATSGSVDTGVVVDEQVPVCSGNLESSDTGSDDRLETAVLLPGPDLARSSSLRRGRTPGSEAAILQPVFGLFVLQVCIYLICRAGFPEGRFGFPVPLAEPGQ